MNKYTRLCLLKNQRPDLRKLILPELILVKIIISFVNKNCNTFFAYWYIDRVVKFKISVLICFGEPSYCLHSTDISTKIRNYCKAWASETTGLLCNLMIWLFTWRNKWSEITTDKYLYPNDFFAFSLMLQQELRLVQCNTLWWKKIFRSGIIISLLESWSTV